MALRGMAQTGGTVQNRPYTDLRPFHFGILVGTHLQDMEFRNVGPHTVTASDGTVYEANVSMDQSRWDPGLTVGVLGELRLSTYFQLRIAPALLFGNRRLTFRNLNAEEGSSAPTEVRQDMKTVYVSTALEMIFAAPRSGNHRPYLVGGLTPMINLSNHNDDYVELKRYDVYAGLGVGCDFYLPYFKLRPELKFMYGLTNSFNSDHLSEIKDQAKLPYASSIDRSRSKMIMLTFYFE